MRACWCRGRLNSPTLMPPVGWRKGGKKEKKGQSAGGERRTPLGGREGGVAAERVLGKASKRMLGKASERMFCKASCMQAHVGVLMCALLMCALELQHGGRVSQPRSVLVPSTRGTDTPERRARLWSWDRSAAQADHLAA